MPTIYVDGQPYEVPEGRNLLDACLSLGLNLPYFCWHPALGSVGACRQCAVKQFRDENDTHGRIVIACMTPAANGTRISIADPEAGEFRASVIEWLMLNHPHDCPVCDEGGECHLQDMTVMTGHNYRRYRFTKRTYRNQYLGPLVNHEMNRCIQCYRCVRFYRGYAGGRDLDVFATHDHVYFGRQSDGVLESEFSGNLVEVCPTGVFTDKTLRVHYTRKWDLQTAPSVCVHCGLGCNTIPGERYGTLRRVLNRFNGQVNGYFLCDRGRYGYEFVNSQRRVRQPRRRGLGAAGPAEVLSSADALQHVALVLSSARGVIGIGSPRASLEANFALRTLVGADHFYTGISVQEGQILAAMLDILRSGPARSPSLEDVRRSDAVLVLGEDVTNVAPVLALALRQSVRQQPLKKAARVRIPEWDDAALREIIQDERGPLFIAAAHATRLDDIATRTYCAAPDDLARLGFAVAEALKGGASQAAKPPEQVRPMPGAVAAAEGVQTSGLADLSDQARTLANDIAEALRGAARPLVVAGTSYSHLGIVHAAANIAWALVAAGRPAHLCFTVPECNSLGLALVGGKELPDAFRAVQEGTADTVIILENDLYRRAEAEAVDAFLASARHVIALDHLENATTARAGLVLPAATFAEGDGTFVNSEGRAQRFYQVFVPEGDIRESWRWLRDVALAAGRAEPHAWSNLDAITTDMIEALPVFRPLAGIAPPASFRIAGLKIARQPSRYSGRTALHADIDIHEPRPPEDPDSPLAFSMEGYQAEPPPALVLRFWAPGWNSVQALNKFQQEVGGPLRGGDPGVRLLEPVPGVQPNPFGDIPGAFRSRLDEWLVVPIYHIFGSEELSILTPGLAELSPGPYLGLNPDDARRLHLQEGAEIEAALGRQTVRLPVRLIPSLPAGVAGLPAGLPGLPGIKLPQWVALTGTRGDETKRPGRP